MPDRPAPTMTTSTCSIVDTSGRRGGELVVECAGRAEQLVAPPLDQSGGVTVVGMEVGAVVLAQLVPHLALHDRRATELLPALAQIAGLVGRTVEGERDADLQHHAGEEPGRADVHGDPAHALGGTH